MTHLGRAFTRMLDDLEDILWGAQDQQLRAAGWEVTRIGRWRRAYRRPLPTIASGPRPLSTGAAHPATVDLPRTRPSDFDTAAVVTRPSPHFAWLAPGGPR